MDVKDILEKLKRLEYHQQLLLKMNQSSTCNFYKLVIEKALNEEEVKQFYKLCEDLSIKLEDQKADGFVNFHPLFLKFKINLPSKLMAEQVIPACIEQELYIPLMTELKKYL